jgi:hypothetical protein
MQRAIQLPSPHSGCWQAAKRTLEQRTKDTFDLAALPRPLQQARHKFGREIWSTTAVQRKMSSPWGSPWCTRSRPSERGSENLFGPALPGLK